MLNNNLQSLQLPPETFPEMFHILPTRSNLLWNMWNVSLMTDIIPEQQSTFLTQGEVSVTAFGNVTFIKPSFIQVKSLNIYLFIYLF